MLIIFRFYLLKEDWHEGRWCLSRSLNTNDDFPLSLLAFSPTGNLCKKYGPTLGLTICRS